MRTVLMVGGPLDGEWLTVTNPAMPVEAAVSPVIIWGEPEPIGPAPRTVVYLPKTVNLFSTLLRVHVCEGTPVERIEATLFEQLITPAARQLVVDSVQLL